MSIFRVQQGLIFQDDFDTLDTERWHTRSPSDAVVLENGQLVVQHTSTGRATSAMFTVPDESTLLMQVYADYHPSLEGDAAGIVVWKNANEKVEFLETADTTTSYGYVTWRAIKRGGLWSFFAQQDDMTWELFDSTVCIDPAMMGVTALDAHSADFRPLKVNRVLLCKGTHIQLTNLEQGQIVQLRDAKGETVVESIVPASFGGAVLELPTIPFEGTLHVYKRTTVNDEVVQVLLSQTEELVEMFGGDIFTKGTDLKIKWNDTFLDEFIPTQLGAIKNGQIALQMHLVNDNKFDVAYNTNIQIAAYLHQFGWKWVDIAPDVEGQPGDYADTALDMGTLQPLSEKPFWLRITKDMNVEGFEEQMVRPTHFYLEVKNY